MRALIAEDDPVTAAALRGALRRMGLDPVAVGDGCAAWELVCRGEAPPLAVIDWMMPGLDGPALCRRIRADREHAGMYVILLTARDSREDIVAGLEAGADDYLVKPFDPAELRARVHAGVRILSLQQQLADKIAALEETLANVKQLKGLLPICSYCKRIRSDEDYWEQVESYISDHSNAQFSHGVCPGCFERAHREFSA